MIRRVWRASIRFLGSAALALWLLVFIGVWSLAATAVPQGAGATPDVVAWASKYGALEPVVRVVGLHQAFTAPVFTMCVILLALSTAVCSWRRTKVAIGRARTLGAAAEADQRSIAESRDVEIVRHPALSDHDALALASETLARFGIKSKRRGDVIASVSPRWSVWGSSVFHWALLVLMIAAFVGNLQRSEGSMSIPVGQTKADAPASYSSVSAGPLHDWLGVHRSIRVDAFDPDFKVGGVDRGAVPTVSVLDAARKVLVKQRVYPNMKLHSGSLSINAPGVGLAVYLSVRGPTGAEVGRLIQIVDFSQTTSGGTVPQQVFARRDSAGNVIHLLATVPLERVGAGYGEWIPRQPSARVLVTAADGRPLVDRTVRPGQDATLPGGGTVRLAGIGWYSRLSLVDDPTIPFIYAAMVVAALGLTLTLVARQQLVLATVLEGPGGAVLAVRMRLWRNTSTNRDEIENALTSALQGDDKETKS